MREEWAKTEMEGARLKDRRRVKSVIRICEALATSPDLSFSAACGPASRQAAHRIFEHADTTADGLLEGHFAATAQRCADRPLVLIAQDTTAFVYGQQQIVGLAPINKSQKSRALLAHAALAMTPSGTPLGLWYLGLWGSEEGTITTRERRQRPLADQESSKWFEGLAAVAERLPAGTQGLLIQDREADIFDFLAAARPARLHLLLRAAYDRHIAYEACPTETEQPPEAEPAAALRTERGKLFAVAARAPVVGHCRVQVPRQSAREGCAARPAREAALEIRLTEVRLQRPRHQSEAEQAEVRVWVICATETDPPEGAAPIRWVLLCTLPVEGLQAACRMLACYAKRWLIERLHYTLKSGLRVEKLQIDDALSLAHALALYYVLAWRLLHLTYTAREAPDGPATTVLNVDEIGVLEAITGQPVSTVAAAILAVARLGGYQPYRSALPPGAKVLWQGQVRLESMTLGWRLAKAQQPPPDEL